MSITLAEIKYGLQTKESWVNRAVSVLADHSRMGVLNRKKFQDYRDELKSFGKIDPIGKARVLCLQYASTLFDVANMPRYDFKGKTFVLTGKLQNFKRKELTEKLESHGAYVSNSVSRRTDVLVVGAKPGSKFTAGQRLSTITWTEDELLQNLKPPSKK